MDSAGAMPNIVQEARNKPFIFIILDRLKVVIEGHSEAAWLGSTGSGGFQPPAGNRRQVVTSLSVRLIA